MRSGVLISIVSHVIFVALALLGTFLVRSGVLTSVHAFATDPKRGIFILAFLVFVIGGSLLLYAWRAKQVGLGGKFDVVSRESLLLSNNVLLAVAAGSVLLGTLYPLIIDALGMGKLSVGPPYFNSVFVPLMVPALFLMGVGPIARWRKASLPELAVRLRWAFLASGATALILPFVLGQWKPLVALGLMLALWIVTTALLNIWERVKTTSGQLSVFQKLKAQTRSYYGMHLAHIGVAVFVLGVTIVTGYQSEQDVRMDLLVPAASVSRCPYKGLSRYWSVQIGDEAIEDIVWSYPAPIPECPKIENLLSFYNEHVDLYVDGVMQQKPVTPFSRR